MNAPDTLRITDLDTGETWTTTDGEFVDANAEDGDMCALVSGLPVGRSCVVGEWAGMPHRVERIGGGQ